MELSLSYIDGMSLVRVMQLDCVTNLAIAPETGKRLPNGLTKWKSYSKTEA